MGLSHSTAARTPPPCKSCGANAADADLSHGLRLCRRCGALVPGLPQASGQGHEEKEADQEQLVAVKKLTVVPVLETLPDADKDNDAEFWLEKFIRPFFSNQPDLVVRRGEVLQISEVEFKIVAMHPPRGVVNRGSELLVTLPPISALQEIARLNVLPAQATLRTHSMVNIAEELLEPYFHDEERLVCEGEELMVGDVQFKIVSCEPTSGHVTSNTSTFTDGEPLPDLERVHLLPIYESLPNSEKNISESDIFSKYLSTYFHGRMRLLELSQEVQINGVDFKVIAAEPARGLVTLQTTIYTHGEPLRDDDLRIQQLHDDEAMARRLQMEESGRFFGNPQMAGFDLRRSSEQFRQRLHGIIETMPEEHQLRPIMQRLHDQLAMNPGRLAQVSSGLGHGPHSLLMSFENMLDLREESGERGIEQVQINHLPTRIFSTTETRNGSEQHTCRVCLCGYEEGDEIRTLPCFHSYHIACIDTWLRQNAKCPICKHPVA